MRYTKLSQCIAATLLERGAAQRYREWAKLLPDFRVANWLHLNNDELVLAIRTAVYPLTLFAKHNGRRA